MTGCVGNNGAAGWFLTAGTGIRYLPFDRNQQAGGNKTRNGTMEAKLEIHIELSLFQELRRPESCPVTTYGRHVEADTDGSTGFWEFPGGGGMFQSLSSTCNDLSGFVSIRSMPTVPGPV